MVAAMPATDGTGNRFARRGGGLGETRAKKKGAVLVASPLFLFNIRLVTCWNRSSILFV